MTEPEVVLSAAHRPGVAMFIDWENFWRRRMQQGLPVDAKRLDEIASGVGRPVRRMVFCDVSRMDHRMQVDLYSCGFVLVHCPRLPSPRESVGKDTVDPMLLDELYGVSNWAGVDEVLLVTADRDFLRAISHVRNALGKKVRIVEATPDDRQSLVMHSDGSIPYCDGTGSIGFASEARGAFDARAYETDDPRLARVLRSLAVTVRCMVDVMAMDVTPLRKIEIINRVPGVGPVIAECITCEAVEERIDFLFAQNVLERTSSRGPKLYRVATRHSFTQYALRTCRPEPERAPVAQQELLASQTPAP